MWQPVARLILLCAALALTGCRGDRAGALFVEVEAPGFGRTASADQPWPDGTYRMPEVSAGGVALFDFDQDGRLDLLQVRHPAPGPLDRGVQNKLWHNRGADGFCEVAVGLAGEANWQGVAIGDVDNNGFPDVYLTSYGRDALYLNHDGKFADATEACGIAGDHWSTSASFVDFDRDGWLDLAVAHFGHFDPDRVCTEPDGRRDYCGPQAFRGEAITLYHNRGDGTFVDATRALGLDKPGRGWGIACADLTGDGWPDIYVANDQEPAHLWVRQDDGAFRDEALERGCALSGLGQSEAGMGIAVGDVNEDQCLDLLVTHIAGEKNTLYLCQPTAEMRTFVDRSAASQMARVDLPYTGWGCGLADLDNDGHLDVAVANGRVRRGPIDPRAELGTFWNAYAEQNLLFRGDGQGRFAHVSDRAGSFTRHVEAHHGLACGDLDNDGRIDLVETTADNTLHVHRNVAEPVANWLTLRLLTGRRDAHGAQVRIGAGGRTRLALANPGYSFASSNDPRAHFGLGPHDHLDSLTVDWPDGEREEFDPPAINRVVTLRQGGGRRVARLAAPPTPGDSPPNGQRAR